MVGRLNDVSEAADFWARANGPISIVTTFDGNQRSGCLVGFFSQCSIDPPRYAMWMSKTNHTFGVALGAELLAVHLVPTDQLELARLFAEESGDWTDKFARCDWEEGPGGLPLLAACPDRLIGRVLEREGASLCDHVAHLLEPVEIQRGDGTDVLHLSDVADFSAGHQA